MEDIDKDGIPYPQYELLPIFRYLDEKERFTLNIIIPGEPAHKQKPLITSRGKFAKIYNTEYTIEQTKRISAAMRAEFDAKVDDEKIYTDLGSNIKYSSQELFTRTPCTVSILAVYELPKSKHRKRISVKMKEKPSKPDSDNITKIVLDAGNGVLWKDDAQATQSACSKYVAAQGRKPYMIVQVSWTKFVAEFGL